MFAHALLIPNTWRGAIGPVVAVPARARLATARALFAGHPEVLAVARGRGVSLRQPRAGRRGGGAGAVRRPRAEHDAAGGLRGPAARPVPPPRGRHRRRRDGRGLPGRAPAAEAALRRQADPARGGRRPAGAGPVRARGPGHRPAVAPEHRRDLRLRPDRGRHVLLRHGVPARPEPGGAGRAARPAAAGPGRLPAAAGLRGAGRGPRRRA